MSDTTRPKLPVIDVEDVRYRSGDVRLVWGGRDGRELQLVRHTEHGRRYDRPLLRMLSAAEAAEVAAVIEQAARAKGTRTTEIPLSCGMEFWVQHDKDGYWLRLSRRNVRTRRYAAVMYLHPLDVDDLTRGLRHGAELLRAVSSGEQR